MVSGEKKSFTIQTIRTGRKEMCEISVIVPVYNKKKYLVNTVKSILMQTFKDFELLLIDDGSTDGSGAVCGKMSALDARVKTFHTENRGVGAARNLGIRKATGKYISFIDADDSVHKTFLEELYGAITENDSEMAVCNYYEINKGRKVAHNYERRNDEDALFGIIRQDLLCVIWNKLFVRE